MLNKTTLNQLHELRLHAMAAKLAEQLETPGLDALPFEDRLSLLVEAEWLEKKSSRISRLISKAGFRFPATVEDIEYLGKHGITKADIQRLCEGSYLAKKQNVILSGPTGVGKTYIANALGRRACYQGTAVLYIRVPDFFVRLSDAQMEGRFSAVRERIADVPLLILDDWGLRTFSREESQELMELFERRYDNASTIISGQAPVSCWHELFPDAVLADAIMDRVVHNAYSYNLSGESMRKIRAERETGRG